MTLWIKLGWRNLWRNRRRSIIELTSIAGSVFLAVFMNNLAKGSYAQMVNDAVKMGSGHIGLYRSDYLELRKPELTFKTTGLVSELEKQEDVVSVFPRLHVPGLIRSSRESRTTVVTGLDISREQGTNPILDPGRISEGEAPTDDDEQGALVGAVLAEELGLEIGKKFVIMVQDKNGDIASKLFRISGLIRTNARMIDAQMVVIPRRVLADIIGKEDSAHEIAVMMSSHTSIERVLPSIQEAASDEPDVKAYAWEKAMPEVANAIKMDYVGLQIIVFFMYLIVGIGTINTLLMSVMERTREFGVLRSIGLGKTGLRKMVFSEAFVLAGTGVIIGMVISVLVGLYTATEGIDYSFMIEDRGFAGTLFDPVMYSTWDWPTMGLLGLCMIVLALAASLYPAHYIMRIRPANAIRKY